VKMLKSQVKTMLTAFFDAKGNIHHEFVPDKQTVNGKFDKELTKRLIARVYHIRPSFRKFGLGIFCATMHRCILQALSLRLWRNKGSPCYSIHPTPLI
jgi:hypothetical protein